MVVGDTVERSDLKCSSLWSRGASFADRDGPAECCLFEEPTKFTP